MEKFWKAALKATGPVAVVGFILSTVVNYLFQAETLKLFSSMQQFILIVILVCGLLIALFASVVTFRSSKGKGMPQNIEIKNSPIAGDVFMGDKNINKSQTDE